MSNNKSPVLEAFAMRQRQVGKEVFTQCGVMWPLEEGPGGFLLLHDLPRKFDGRIWLLPRKPREAKSEQGGAA